MSAAMKIPEYNRMGIQEMHLGRQQEAMNCFEAALANLLVVADSNNSSVSAMAPSIATKRRLGEKAPRLGQVPQGEARGVAFPMEFNTLDKAPEHAISFFNQALLLPQLTESDENGVIPSEKHDVIYAGLLYNMALVLHSYGLQNSCDVSLKKALDTYELAHGVLLRDLHEKPCPPKSRDIHHWLLYAMFNNMANIYTYACAADLTNYYLGRLRMVLSYTDSCMLRQEDLIFYTINLDVSGGSGVVSASAA